ncbi:MAG TPA: hypothetical protein VFK05_30215 [Polyangiaceae bacterium]|nr:hypothetical protein [Polyangiaceae bacterium]
MSQTAVLVWLSATAILPTFRADLDAFAHSRLLRLEAPRENAAAYHTSAYAPDAVAQIESSLEEARNAAAALEQSRALGALERAERVLREHPELPQSAWLMAEIWQQSAEIENSAPDGAEAASVLRKRAAALEGPRATPFSDSSDRAPDFGPELEAARAVRVEGLEPGDELSWDGVRSEPPVMTATGSHHVRVARDGRLLWAGWLELGAGVASVRLPVPETVACSADDIGRGHFAQGRAIAAAHARCDSYVLARAREGGIEVALCERERCGNVVIWEHRQTDVAAARPAKKKLWPYAIAASVGALAVTSIALWRAGVFEHGEPSSREVWVFNGQKQMALGF